MNLFEERKQRIEAAVALGEIDRVPVVSGNAAFSAVACNVPVADYISDMELNCTCSLKAAELSGDIDGVQARTTSPEVLPGMWLSQIKVPGRELSRNELWQVCEKELMSQEDYDIILEGGFEPWLEEFKKTKLGDPNERMKHVIAYGPEAKRRFYEAGLPCIKEGVVVPPFEMICGGRSLGPFFTEDLLEIPEKVDAVFEKIQDYTIQKYTKQFASPNKPYGVWIGGWRGTPDMISREWFLRFAWKYTRELIELCLDYDVLPVLHLDSCWNKGLDVFKDIPKGKCIMALDGRTDMKLAKEVVGDSMCIMGDVPAPLLAFGKQEDVYNYVTEQIKYMGPTGYIISTGCDTPFNAKLENVQMMAKARDDYFRHH